MRRRTTTTSEFIENARAIHGDKYDYSKVNYEGARVEVCIGCPIHGFFHQKPTNHLSGNGCAKCALDGQKRLVFGKGINDLYNVSQEKSYGVWMMMLRRCYDTKLLVKEPSYVGCYVCDEWALYSNFKSWFDKNYIEGFELDKDLLVKGNKEYSSSTCCFLPKEINSLLTKRQNHRGEYPIGVHKANKNSFKVLLSIDGRLKKVGVYDSEQEAFVAYKKNKEENIKRIAKKFKGTISNEAYDALMNYNVEITD